MNLTNTLESKSSTMTKILRTIKVIKKHQYLESTYLIHSYLGSLESKFAFLNLDLRMPLFTRSEKKIHF